METIVKTNLETRVKKLPCTYTKEEFANVLSEADEDFKAGRFVTQDELRARYGL